MKEQYTYEDLKDMFICTVSSRHNMMKVLRKFLDIDGLRIIKPFPKSCKPQYSTTVLPEEVVRKLIIGIVCYNYTQGSTIGLNFEHPLIKTIITKLGGIGEINKSYSIIRKDFDTAIKTYTYQTVKRVDLLDEAKKIITQDNKTVYNFLDQIKPKKEVKITEQESEKSIVDRLAKERSLERKNKELEERISQLEIKVDRVIELVSAVDDKTIIMAKMIRLLNEKDSEAQKLRA